MENKYLEGIFLCLNSQSKNLFTIFALMFILSLWQMLFD